MKFWHRLLVLLSVGLGLTVVRPAFALAPIYGYDGPTISSADALPPTVQWACDDALVHWGRTGYPRGKSTARVSLDSRGSPVAPKAAAGEVQAGQRVFRVWGKDPARPDLAASQSGPWGRSWIRVAPGSVPKYRDVAGLPDEANMGRFASEGILRDPMGVKATRATPIGAN